VDISGPHSLGMVPLVVLPNTAVEVDMDTSVAEEVDTSPTELDTQDYTASRTYVPVDDKESSKNDKPSVYCHSAYVVEHANTRGPTRSQQGEVSHPQPPIESTTMPHRHSNRLDSSIVSLIAERPLR